MNFSLKDIAREIITLDLGVSSTNYKLDTLKTDTENLSYMSSLDIHLDNIETGVSTTNNKLDVLKTDTENLSFMPSLDTRLNSIDTGVESTNSKLDTLKTDTDNLSYMPSLDTHLSNIDTGVDSTNSKLDTLIIDTDNLSYMPSLDTRLDNIDIGISQTNYKIDQIHNRQWFSSRLFETDGSDSSLNENYTSASNEARFIATTDNTYITEVLIYIRDSTFSWTALGGASVGGNFQLSTNVNGVVSTITDQGGVNNNLTLKMNFPDFWYANDGSSTAIFARRDYSNAPMKLNTNDKIYITLERDYSDLDGFIVSVSGYVQN